MYRAIFTQFAITFSLLIDKYFIISSFVLYIFAIKKEIIWKNSPSD